jgi:hypothetical protein
VTRPRTSPSPCPRATAPWLSAGLSGGAATQSQPPPQPAHSPDASILAVFTELNGPGEPGLTIVDVATARARVLPAMPGLEPQRPAVLLQRWAGARRPRRLAARGADRHPAGAGSALRHHRPAERPGPRVTHRAQACPGSAAGWTRDGLGAAW